MISPVKAGSKKVKERDSPKRSASTCQEIPENKVYTWERRIDSYKNVSQESSKSYVVISSVSFDDWGSLKTA